jgi:DNA repair photolyase
MSRAHDNPPNRFEPTLIEYEEGESPDAWLEIYEDRSRSILVENSSPDLGFRWSLNAYRGCFHACAYCYARPSHEYLGFGAGTDFDRKILVKPRAAELLREAFESPRWRGELVVVSGNTDAYQRLENRHRLTRACLEVFAEYRNPVHVITKSPLVERDIDVLGRIREVTNVGVSISIPFWDESVARAIEPFVASPGRRIETIRALSRANIPVTVNVAPLIPGLGDRDMPRVLEAAARAGATGASMIMLRLPGAVRNVFESRLSAALPLAAERVLSRTREVRGGRLNDPRFGSRMTGEGHYAEMIADLFASTTNKLGLRVAARTAPNPSGATFRRPARRGTQLSLFERR